LSLPSCPAKHPRKALLFIWLAFFAASSVRAAQEARPVPGDPRRNVLKNGLTWIYQEDASSSATSLFIVIGGGQIAEPPGQSGLAYLATRLAVEVPDSDKVHELMTKSTRLSVVGQEDCSVIGIQCLSENLEDALRTVGGIMSDPLLSGLRIDANKENMRYQAKSALDDSIYAGHAAAMKAFFGPGGCGESSWGTEASLDALRKKDIAEFYKSHIVAANMVASVASDLDERTIARLLEKYFGTLKTGVSGKEASPATKTPASKEIAVVKEAAEAYLGLAFPIPGLTPRNFALAALVDDILSGGIGSRLWQLRFRDKLAYNFNANVTQTCGQGLLEAYLETSPAKVPAARAALRRVLGELADRGLTAGELETAVTDAEASFLRLNETKEVRARNAGLFEFRGLGCGFVRNFPGELRIVPLEELNAYLKTVLALDRAVEVVIGPKTD
jgi:zinc protease